MSVSSAHPNLLGSLNDLDEWAMAVRQLEAKGALPGGARMVGPAPSLEGLAVRGFPVGLLPTSTTFRRKANGQVLTLYAPSTLDSAVAAYSSMVPVVIAVPSPTSSSLIAKIEEFTIARQHHASSTVQSALAEREQQSLTFLEMVVGGSSVELDSKTTADGTNTTSTTTDCLYVAVDMMTLHQLLLLPDHAIVSAPNPLLGNLPPGADAAAASTQYYSNPDRTLTAVADTIWELNGTDLLSILLPIPFVPNDIGSGGGPSPSLPHSPLSFSGWTTLRLSHRGGEGAPPSGSAEGGGGDPPSQFYNALVGSSDEANTFGATPTIDRVHYSYLCVLSYLGWRLHSEETGELDRHRGWKQRYSTLLHPPTTTSSSSSSVLPLDTVLTALLTFLLGMRLVTFATRLVLFIVDEAKAGRLAHLVVPEGAIVRTTLLPVLSTSLYLDGPVMGPEEVARVEAAIKKMVDNESDSE